MAAHNKTHAYQITVEWTGNLGSGTKSYTAYDRAHDVYADGKPVILGSSDPAFRGDRSRYNPEELLVASLSTCHMLWYLHLATQAKIVVTRYVDRAIGSMAETQNGSGHFTEVVLQPDITVEPGADLEVARDLHEKAHHFCFIANSVNFPVRCEPSFQIQDSAFKTNDDSP
jgi:organic hydroperoxide reductase OsmC/OhrA